MYYEIVEFSDQPSFRHWFTSNRSKIPGVWLRIYKKASGVASISYAQALDEALCFGWIDGQKKSFDALSFLQKFTPRRPKSLWSKRNIEHVERLTKAGLMTASGLREVAAAKSDGRWEAAYDSAATLQIPDDFLAELRNHPKAEAFFSELNKTNRYAIAWRLQTAKTEVTRKRRIEKIIALLESGQSLH